MSGPTVVVRTVPVGVNYPRQPVISGRPVIGETLPGLRRSVDRNAADHVHLPVAALRRRPELRWEVLHHSKTINDALEAVLDLAPAVSHTPSAAELLAAGGYQTSFRALEPGHLTIEWTTERRARTVRVAFARGTFGHRGTYPVKIGLTPEGEGAVGGQPSPAHEAGASYEGHKVIQAVVAQRDGRFRYVAP